VLDMEGEGWGGGGITLGTPRGKSGCMVGKSTNRGGNEKKEKSIPGGKKIRAVKNTETGVRRVGGKLLTCRKRQTGKGGKKAK